MTHKVLIIVDFQKDFCDKENGSLYVNGAEMALENIIKYINENDLSEVVFTVDWHKYSDKSFEINGGQWPIHCVQYSEGAGINGALLKAVNDKNIPYQVFIKGDCFNHEEYGAFEHSMDEYGSYDTSTIVTTNYMETSQYPFYKEMEYVICGLAGDYCVFETYKNIKDAEINVTPFYDGMAFIGEKFDFTEKYIPKEKPTVSAVDKNADDIAKLMARIYPNHY